MDNINWRTLARYLADELSPDEVQDVESWLDADPARYWFMEELRRIWDASASTDPEEEGADVEAGWEAVSEQMDASDAPGKDAHRPERSARGPRGRRTRPSSSLRERLLWGTAVLAIVIGSVALGLHFQPGSSPGESDEMFQEIETGKGERTRIHLPDGTRIMLSVESRLAFSNDFGKGKRVARLDGEAYFEVASEDRPFIVHTDEGRVDVHGTAFNVRSYKSESSTQVAVREGQVSVRSRGKEGGSERALLTAGQFGLVEKDRVTTKQGVDVTSYLGWTEGRLVFTERTLPEVTAELERWYDVEFVIEDSALRSLRLTANIERQSLPDVLRIIAASLGIEYEIRGATVILKS